MFRFPDVPDTLVTLQIECVSCQEVFTLAEDAANAARNDKRDWRMPTAGRGHSPMHPRPQQTRQLVRPLMRATPEFGETSWDRWPAHRETAVNCPRCGTDNRNWLRLAYARPADNRRTWVYEHLSKFYLLWASVIFTGLLLLYLLCNIWSKNNLIAYVLMIVIMILGTLIPIFSIPNQWRQIRLHKIISKYDKTLPPFSYISPAFKQGAFYLSLFVLAVPVFLYILAPTGVALFQDENTLVARYDQALVELDAGAINELETANSPKLEPSKNALMGIQRLLYPNLFVCDMKINDPLLESLSNINLDKLSSETAVQIKSVRNNLRDLQQKSAACDHQSAYKTVASLSALYHENKQKCSATLTEADPECSNTAIKNIMLNLETLSASGEPLFLGTLADEMKLTLKEARMLAQETTDPTVKALLGSDLDTIEDIIKQANGSVNVDTDNNALLITWIKYVGLSSLIAVITAVVSTYLYVTKINRHLPQPLCYSLNQLTRVVLWEARHSLEINGHFDRIEWHVASRNANGGITLRGHLTPPTTGEETEKYIRAMRYTLISDLWGHIITADAKSVRIQPSVLQAWDQQQKTENTLNHMFVPQTQTQAQ